MLQPYAHSKSAANVAQHTSKSIQEHAHSKDTTASADTNSPFFPIMELPRDVLPKVLSYLPMDMMCSLRLLNKALSSAGKHGIQISIENTINHNDSIKNSLISELKSAKCRAERNGDNARTVELKIIPLTFPKKTNNAIKKVYQKTTLSEDYLLQATSIHNQKILLGVHLKKTPVRARVPVQQYLRELQFQKKHNVPPTLFSSQEFEKINRFLTNKINQFIALQQKGVKFIFVPYLPILKFHSFKKTTFDLFSEQTQKPLQEYTLDYKHISTARSLTGLDLSNQSLALSVPVSDVEKSFNEAFSKIDHDKVKDRALLEKLHTAV